MEKITVHYTYPLYLEASRIAYQNTKFCWFNRFFFGICFCIIFTFVWSKIILGILDLIGIFLSLLSLAYLFYEWSILPFSCKNLFEKQPMFKGEAEMYIDDNVIIDKTTLEKSTLERTIISETKIQIIHKYVLSKNLLLIFNTPATFFIIPKKFCVDEQQFARIVQIVRHFPQDKK